MTVPLDLKPIPMSTPPLAVTELLRILNDNQKKLMEQWRVQQVLIESIIKRLDYLETTIARQ